jgi:hypothetical protein
LVEGFGSGGRVGVGLHRFEASQAIRLPVQ